MKKTIKILVPLVSLVALELAGMPLVTIATAATSQSQTTIVQTALTKINLNTADTSMILSAKVKGIGIKRAQAIVDYRTQHGPYQSLEELAKVKGVGEKFVKSHLTQLHEVFSLS